MSILLGEEQISIANVVYHLLMFSFLVALLDEDRLSIANAARLVRVHTATVWRWVLNGVKGRKLRSVQIGGRRFVLRRDLDAFLAPQTGANEPQQDLGRSAERAGEKLDELFTGKPKVR